MAALVLLRTFSLVVVALFSAVASPIAPSAKVQICL
jgi:hypothetical protein